MIQAHERRTVKRTDWQLWRAPKCATHQIKQPKSQHESQQQQQQHQTRQRHQETSHLCRVYHKKVFGLFKGGHQQQMANAGRRVASSSAAAAPHQVWRPSTGCAPAAARRAGVGQWQRPNGCASAKSSRQANLSKLTQELLSQHCEYALEDAAQIVSRTASRLSTLALPFLSVSYFN